MTTIKLEGAAEINKALKKLESRMQAKIVTKAVSAGSNFIAREIRKKTPVRSEQYQKKISAKSEERRGPRFLRKAVKVKTTRKNDGAVTRTIYISKKAYYAMFIEFGTAHQSKRPFMWPAVESSKDAAVNKIVTTLQGGLKAAQGKK